MSSLTLKKTSWLRRRFGKSSSIAFSALCDWIDIGSDLKSNILLNSTFQLVGAEKTIIEIDLKNHEAYVLFEVVGVPKEGILSYDMPPFDVLIWECPSSIFEVDFPEIMGQAERLRRLIPQKLTDNYHIVLDGTHLALHFFIQKDYIQSK